MRLAVLTSEPEARDSVDILGMLVGNVLVVHLSIVDIYRLFSGGAFPSGRMSCLSCYSSFLF